MFMLSEHRGMPRTSGNRIGTLEIGLGIVYLLGTSYKFWGDKLNKWYFKFMVFLYT